MGSRGLTAAVYRSCNQIFSDGGEAKYFLLIKIFLVINL